MSCPHALTSCPGTLSTGLPSASAVNTSGVPRLTKFYSPIHQSQQTLVEKIYALVSARPASLCNFLDAPELEAFLKPPKGGDGEKLRVVYRSYATLYFMFVVDSAESELGILDLIQVSRHHNYNQQLADSGWHIAWGEKRNDAQEG